MKKLILALVLTFATHAFAQAATATATFSFSTNGNPVTNPATVEYFVEQKSGSSSAPVFTEVAKATASPIIYILPNATVGQALIFRIRARLIGLPLTASTPTPEIVGYAPLNAPGNATVIFAFPASTP